MLDIVVNCQLGRACCFLETSTFYQLEDGDIPKRNGKMRSLGIASYEDRIVQLAVKKILEAIYEPRFLNCMYGFRMHSGRKQKTEGVWHAEG